MGMGLNGSTKDSRRVLYALLMAIERGKQNGDVRFRGMLSTQILCLGYRLGDVVLLRQDRDF